jgi:sugar phosphate isomerase/epimerase
MNRRDFLKGASSAACFAATSGLAGSPADAAADKLKQIGVSTWSFHNYFPSTRDEHAPPNLTKMDVMDFPEMVADRFHVHAIEVVAPHFADTSDSYLTDFKKRLERAHCRLVNIPADVDVLWKQPGLSDKDEKKRQWAIEAYAKWIPVAKALGCRSIRCDPGEVDLNDITPTVDSYRQLVARGAPQGERGVGVQILIENHGGPEASHPEVLKQIFDTVAGKWIGALPDFGNFPDDETRYRGLPILFPYARTVCHAKNSTRHAGKPAQIDVKRCVQIAKSAGFQGVYSIEYSGPDAYGGVQQVVDELARYV